MLYSNMKLHVSAYNGHRQVSIPIKGVYIYLSGEGGVDVEISMHQFALDNRATGN